MATGCDGRVAHVAGMKNACFCKECRLQSSGLLPLVVERQADVSGDHNRLRLHGERVHKAAGQKKLAKR